MHRVRGGVDQQVALPVPERDGAFGGALNAGHQLACQGAQDVGRRERLCQRDGDAVQNFELTPVALGDAAPG